MAEALIDLKQGIEGIIKNKTFNIILATLLSIGNFLNGTESKGFQIEYLSKVPEVKDTTHKHSLLYHLCQMIHEKYPQSSDLHSEVSFSQIRNDMYSLCNKLRKIVSISKIFFYLINIVLFTKNHF